MPVWKWSQTANSNGTADGTCPWPEGMAPSQVNDSARGNMAAIAMYRDDIAGAIVTGGTSTAYTVASYSVYDTLAHMSGAMIAFTPHATNGATVTLNVDGLGAKPLRSAPSVELPSGAMILGTPYVALYNNADAVFYLHGGAGNPYNIPLGGMIDYTGSTAPNSAFVLPYGQAISRTTYATFFSLVSTAYGVGDGSTTFNVPDLRGRVGVAPDNMGGSAASRVTTAGSGIDGSTIGSVGGAQNVTMAQSALPNYQPIFTGALNTPGTIQTTVLFGQSTGPAYQPGAGNTPWVGGTAGQLTTSFTPAGTISSINGGVAQTATNNMPPSIVLPKILRII